VGEENFGLRSLCAWIRYKFGIEATPDEFSKVEDRREIAEILIARAEEAYSEKEKEYPVLTGISAFTSKQGTQIHLDREGLILWMQGRFGASLSIDELALNRDELKNQLVLHTQDAARISAAKLKETQDRVSKIFGKSDDDVTAVVASDDGAIEAMSQYLKNEYGSRLSADDLGRMTRPQMMTAAERSVDDRFHPEMRRMERQVLLTIVDETWKNHLLAMDHLRSSVQLKGYAQLDPKVEYKREGMRLFEKMWESIGERATDLIFRMESFNEDFVRSTWVDARTRHDEASTAAIAESAPPESASQRAAEQSNRDDDVRPEPIRHMGPKVGRNDPCPCGSGKKYKSCCLRNMAGG
jgi:preprotein translocase subunit SecA